MGVLSATDIAPNPRTKCVLRHTHALAAGSGVEVSGAIDIAPTSHTRCVLWHAHALHAGSAVEVPSAIDIVSTSSTRRVSVTHIRCTLAVPSRS